MKIMKLEAVANLNKKYMWVIMSFTKYEHALVKQGGFMNILNLAIV